MVWDRPRTNAERETKCGISNAAKMLPTLVVGSACTVRTCTFARICTVQVTHRPENSNRSSRTVRTVLCYGCNQIVQSCQAFYMYLRFIAHFFTGVV